MWFNSDDRKALAAVLSIVARIEDKVDNLKITESKNMSALDDTIASIQKEVGNNTTVTGSVQTLVQNLAQQLAAALAAAVSGGATPAQLQQLTNIQTALAGNDTTLAGLVAANTSSAPAPTP